MVKWKMMSCAPKNKPILVYKSTGKQEVVCIVEDSLNYGKDGNPIFWTELPEEPNVDVTVIPSVPIDTSKYF